MSHGDRVISGDLTMKNNFYILSILVVMLLAACGDTSTPSPVVRTVKSVIKTTSLTADKNIGGISLTISMPAGVTPPLQADGKIDALATATMVSSAGRTPLSDAIYAPASGAIPGQLTILIAVKGGFSANDEITIHLLVADGSYPKAGDFSLLAFEAYSGIDASGNGGVKIYDRNVTDGSNTITLDPNLTTTIL